MAGSQAPALETPLQTKLLLGERIIYLLPACPPSRSLRNEGKAGSAALSRTVPWWARDPVGSALAVQAPEKSLTKSAQKR